MSTAMTYREVQRRRDRVRDLMHRNPHSERTLRELDEFYNDVLDAIANGEHEGSAEEIARIAVGVFPLTRLA